MHVEPAHARKGQVEDDCLRRVLFDDAQRIDAVPDGSDSVTGAFECEPVKLAEGRVVLDDEDGRLIGPKYQPCEF
jgi:hypothetical protein